MQLLQAQQLEHETLREQQQQREQEWTKESDAQV